MMYKNILEYENKYFDNEIVVVDMIEDRMKNNSYIKSSKNELLIQI